ncbi:MAG: methyltransferase [Flavobacteriaceae bacterium CG2_30_34_30]|nr:MAG: methyltransferase [Flavobacteriaceae bacterium CG2_30_34_30]
MKPSNHVYLKTKDFLVSGEEFLLVSNTKIDFLETMPKPKPEDLPTYYISDAYISHSDKKKDLIDKVYHIVKRVALKQKVSLIIKENNGVGKLLDIGSGTGEFLLTAKQKKWEVHGVEPNEGARKLSEKKGITVLKELHQVTQNNFDVITLWHVLEHVPNLETYILQISKLLKPTGTLIVALPNFKSWDAKHYQKFWAAYDVPRHLWHFSKTAIQTLFSEHPFHLVKIKPMLFDAFYVSLLSEKYKTGKNNWAKAIFFGICSNVSGIFTKEFSSHIYVLKKE